MFKKFIAVICNCFFKAPKVATKPSIKKYKSSLYFCRVDFEGFSTLTSPVNAHYNNIVLHNLVLNKMTGQLPSKSIQLLRISKKTNKIYVVKDKNKNPIDLGYIARNN